MAHNICLVVTDAVSFNVLYQGQLEYLAEKGFNLTLICGGSADSVNSLRGRNVGHVVDLGLVRAPSVWVDSAALIRLLWHFCFNRYDLVMTSTPKALLIGSIAAFLTMQPRRVAFFQGRVYENFRGLRRWVYRSFDRLTAACVHEVLFVSRSLMSEFSVEIQLGRGKGQVLGDGSGNGICPETFSKERVPRERVDEIRRDLGLSEADFVILVVGRICSDKGLAEITHVAERLACSSAKLILVGPPEGGAATALLRKLVASAAVHHVPFTSDVVSYFALADVHLFLSHREGFGNVAIEAAAMGVPTVAFDVVGVRDSVGHGESGVRVAFGDVDAVVAVLQEMMENREKMREQFSLARQWAIKRFSRMQVWTMFADFYRGPQPVSEAYK